MASHFTLHRLEQVGWFPATRKNATTHFPDKITGANGMATRLSLETNRSRIQTRSKAHKRILSTQTISHKGNQTYTWKVFSSVLTSVEKVSRRMSIPHGSATCRTFVQESPLHLHRKSWCLPRSSACECAVAPSKALDLFHRFPHKSERNHADKITKAE